MKKEDLPDLAEAAMNVNRLMGNNPKVLCLDEVKEIMSEALD